MKQAHIIFLITFFILGSCKNNESSKLELEENFPELDTTKLYQIITINYRKNNILEEYEVYLTKKKDSIWNQWKIYKNGVIDSSKSKFYTLKIEGKKSDSVLKGTISFHSPFDSIPASKIKSRTVTFAYLQKINDSLIFKKIYTDKNVIHFDYYDFENMSFIGYISDLRFIEIDSVPGSLLLDRNSFAVDSEPSTNNTYVELLK
ncbi:hypothetical protein FK178_06380 [Antarcticibacterium arcticum]|uniref:Lipoprotein n=1 Tax=Antarcticibacterium arcticum TaxID=2585771 RepID=A0A5B8YJR5_9FLAO|nr:hypothetical protein [Antarcticibacterium arcticum]QED37368.1 hypothetical protein FK178_06380 [Antarcticibacterium arcticum]